MKSIVGNKILVVGLFLSKKNQHKILRTPADQLAEVLKKNGYQVITTSIYVQRLFRLLDTIYTILVNRKKFDIAIVPFYGGFRSYVWEEITLFLLKKINKKVVLIIHGGAIPQRMKIKSRKYIKTMKRADVLVCPSEFLIHELKEYHLQAILVENIIELNQYLFQQKNALTPKLLWMRTFEDIYDPLMAIDILVKLKEEHANATMVMAGHDRGMLQPTINYAKEKNVLDCIEFPGYITNEQKNKYAKTCSIYICTNKVDNAPISLIEMMALGVPIVTVNAGGIPYLVTDNYDCLMINNRSVNDMVEKINELINNPSEASRLTLNGRASAQRFGESPVMQKWNTIFENLRN